MRMAEGPSMLTALASVKVLLGWRSRSCSRPGIASTAMRTLGSSRRSVLLPALIPSLVLGCGAGEPGATGAPNLGTGEPGVLTSSDGITPAPGVTQPAPSVTEAAGERPCANVNSLAASLAVAMAQELHRWDALADFELRSGKLALSATGELHCQ